MGNFFIDRPVFAAVISIIITLAGFMAMQSTPIAQYPDIAPPTVSVSTGYPGATAEVIANTVAAPLEQQINGVDGMLYMASTSTSTGGMFLSVVFEPGTDPDMAQVNVQNRVNQATALLPDVVNRQGVTVSKSSGSFLMAISIYSDDDRYEPVYLGNYTNLYILDPIKRLPGANTANMFPEPDLAMRIWLQPEQMAQLGVATQDISTAIQQQNKAYGIGSIGQSPAPAGTQQSFVVSTKGMLSNAAEFENIIIRTAREGSAIVRLKDVARVELAAKDYSITTRVNGKKSAVIVVYQQPGANAIETSKQVRNLLKNLEPGFPEGMEYKIVMDTSKFTEASIEKVVHTFFEAVALVVLVVFLFLQSFRATLIPVLAVPIAIIGTYIGIKLLGFSTNMLTLFGMILAIGLVVDDAIIVVENVEHNMATFGMNSMEAAKKAMKDLTGALIAIVLVLCSVFMPVAFLGGMTGTLYKQFAVTIAISMVLSGVVALTLTPALAARILKPAKSEKKGFFKWFEDSFVKVTTGYVAVVRWLINHRFIGMALFAGMLVAVVALFKVVPGSFVPEEDQGYMFVGSFLPDAASLERTSKMSTQMLPLLRSNPAVEDITQIDGYSMIDGTYKENSSLMFIALKPYDQRKDAQDSAFSVVHDLGRKLSSLKEGVAFPINPPSIPGLGSMGGFEFFIQNKSSATPQELDKVTKAFIAETRKRKELSGVSSTFSANQQQLYLDVDRARAELLGIPVSTIFDTLQSYFGSAYVGQFVEYGRIWQVIMQSQPEHRDKPNNLTQIYVRSTNGAIIPLSAVATFSYLPGPGILPRFNGFPAAKLNGNQAVGYSSSQAIAAMEDVAKTTLPGGYAYAWAGQAFEEKKAGSTSAIAFAFGLIMVFLILAAQYEKWSLPIGVVMSVPFAICGALLLTWGRGLENDVYFQVGLVTLVGLSAKNAILIIEFAADNLRKGMSPTEAAIEAARLRLRPIVMTSMAFILGCFPMSIASGAGANSLHSIGTGVIGGMLASTLVASCFVPLFFVLLEEWSSGFSRKKQDGLAKQSDAAGQPGTGKDVTHA
ncbi:MAG: multidrug efflux RND transporter permease subunit [Desulfuromonadaceae bacterium]|nr:multidrug efflux RND transporter permease subunit [Desulfuromonadaceae bacterium]